MRIDKRERGRTSSSILVIVLLRAYLRSSSCPCACTRLMSLSSSSSSEKYGIVVVGTFRRLSERRGRLRFVEIWYGIGMRSIYLRV